MVENLGLIGIIITVIGSALKLSGSIDASVTDLRRQISAVERHLAILETKLTAVEHKIDQQDERGYGTNNPARRR